MRSQSFCKFSSFVTAASSARRTASRGITLSAVALLAGACSSDSGDSDAPLTPAPPTVPVPSAPLPNVTPTVSPSTTAPVEQPPGSDEVAPSNTMDPGSGLAPTDTNTQPSTEPLPSAPDGTVSPDPTASPSDTANASDGVPPTTEGDGTSDATEMPTTDEPGCSEMPAPSEQITAFDNWDLTEFTWGEEPHLTGGYFTYAGDDSVLEPFLSEEEPELRLIGNVQSYFGIGLWFGPCVDASEYLGISFTITGELGDPEAVEEDPLLNGEVELQLQTSKNYVIDTENAKGECEGSWAEGTCKSNVAIVPVDDAEPLVELLWEDFTGGVPEATVNPRQLLGLQWQFNCEESEGGPGCDMDVTIDNVQFILP